MSDQTRALELTKRAGNLATQLVQPLSVRRNIHSSFCRHNYFSVLNIQKDQLRKVTVTKVGCDCQLRQPSFDGAGDEPHARNDIAGAIPTSGKKRIVNGKRVTILALWNLLLPNTADPRERSLAMR